MSKIGRIIIFVAIGITLSGCASLCDLPATEDENIEVTASNVLMGEYDGFQKVWRSLDSRGIPYIEPNALPCIESLGWADAWTPWTDAFENHITTILPQADEQPLYLQDLSARNFSDRIGGGQSRSISLAQLQAVLEQRLQTTPGNAILKDNLAWVAALNEKQARLTTPLQPGQVYMEDLDGDGTEERIELQQNPLETKLFFEEPYMLYAYRLKVDDAVSEEYINTDISFFLLDLETCKAFCVQPNGYHRNYVEQDAVEDSRIITYAGNGFHDLGCLNGRLELVLGQGRFTTGGHIDQMWSSSAVRGVVHEYAVHEGALYHMKHGWQGAGDIWQLGSDLSFYGDTEGSVSPKSVESGSNILFVGYSDDDWLYFVSETGEQGYIKLVFDGDNDPIALPGGKRLSEYLLNFFPNAD